ncbi:putative integrase [Saccharolobus islandicus]|uniref:putative integrase n=1 Tax=Saccharolobus islandicus TaxID=43080 RepID=UPI001266F0D6|nr:putative integrase [Sulfolobus islandicus]
MGNKTYTFGDIRIREVKGKYYVYIIEKDNEGNRRDHYIGPLDKIMEFYISSGGLEVTPNGGSRGTPYRSGLALVIAGSNPTGSISWV